MANTLKFGNGEWATKKGSTLAYNSENGNYKPLPFTFDRSTSATRVNKQGLIEVVSNNEPRIDFLNDSKGALLLEPTRSNSLLQSNQFDTTWYNSNSFETESEGGFGGLNYWTITKTAASGWIRQNLSVSGVNTLSVYAKSGSLNWIRMIATGSSTASTWFDLQNGVVGSADFDTISSSIESVGNGWYRCSITVDIGTINGVRFYPADDNNNVSGTSGTILIQSAQLEQGSYATSYIPTQGSIGTRVAETCEQTPPSGIIGQTEGTIFIETKLPQEIPTSSNYFTISDGTDNNAYIFQFRNNGNFRVFQNGVDTANLAFLDSSIDFSKNNKIAFKYGQLSSSMALYINGVEISLQAGFVYENTIGINTIKMAYVSGSLNLYSEINDIKLYNTALTDQELQALTKI